MVDALDILFFPFHCRPDRISPPPSSPVPFLCYDSPTLFTFLLLPLFFYFYFSLPLVATLERRKIKSYLKFLDCVRLNNTLALHLRDNCPMHLPFITAPPLHVRREGPFSLCLLFSSPWGDKNLFACGFFNPPSHSFLTGVRSGINRQTERVTDPPS